MDASSQDSSSFYSKAEGYWRAVCPTVDGMLGGYGSISSVDIAGSRAFLRDFLGDGEGKTGTGRALDCGAGIGRISKRLLLPLFRTVDLVDVTPDFLDEARRFLGGDAARVGGYYCCGLQEFVPEPGRYDLIWIQWVIGHLTDADLVSFLRRCQAALRPSGLVVVKDNVSLGGVVPDAVDSSVCRDLDTLRRLVGRAGLSVVRQRRQLGFPQEIYQVFMLALR